MRKPVLFAVTLIACATLLLSLSASAFAEADLTGFPYGQYSGSAAGGDGEAFPITVYIGPGGAEGVEFTVLTPKLPIPVKVSATNVARVGESSEWTAEVAVNEAGIELEGAGQVRVIVSGGVASIYGSGEGSYRGDGGSGNGFAERIGDDMGTAEQVADAFAAMASGPPKDDAAAVEAPPRYEDVKPVADTGSAGDFSVGSGALFTEPMDFLVKAPFVMVVFFFIFFGFLL